MAGLTTPAIDEGGWPGASHPARTGTSRRLAGSDAGFLFIETPRQTSVCVDWVQLAAPAPGTAPVSMATLRAHVERRLPLLPSWRWRLQPVPGRIHHPVWIDDPDFDLDHHLRHRTLPAPGGDDEVDALLAEVDPQLLDLRHPLWQLTLVDGLAGGRQALLFRFHHTIADGAALLHTLDLLLGPEPADLDARATSPAQPPPRPRTLLGAALREQARNWREVPAMVRRTKERFAAVEARREEAEAFVPRSMGDAPGTRLNQGAPEGRGCARTTLPTAQLQAVRAAVRERGHDVTLNDVVLGVVAGALRAYLAEREGVPQAPLVANVPVSGDPPGSPPRQWGNCFSNFFCTLATDVDDPVERLLAIAAGTAEAKVQLDLQGRDTLPAWLDRIPPLIAEPASRLMDKRFDKDPSKADFSVLVSNVRVVAPQWRLGAQPVEHVWMSGPIADHAGLNVTITGFGDDLHVALVTSPAAVDAPRELADGFHAALEELLACAS